MDNTKLEPSPNNPSGYEQLNAGQSAQPVGDALGDPMDIEDAARLLGCSVWTVRQKYLPQGMPHLRASAAGKLVFFRQQVIDWILKRQRKQF